MSKATLPLRATVNLKMTLLHHQVLEVIAGYGKKGCWLSRELFGALLNCHPQSITNTITDLVKWGYVEARRSPRDGRQRIYNIIFADDDNISLTKLAHERLEQMGDCKPRRRAKRKGDCKPENADCKPENAKSQTCVKGQPSEPQGENATRYAQSKGSTYGTSPLTTTHVSPKADKRAPSGALSIDDDPNDLVSDGRASLSGKQKSYTETTKRVLRHLGFASLEEPGAVEALIDALADAGWTGHAGDLERALGSPPDDEQWGDAA